jgi:hypothetical protein
VPVLLKTALPSIFEVPAPEDFFTVPALLKALLLLPSPLMS